MPVFPPQLLSQLVTKHRSALNDLAYVEQRLNERFVASEEVTRALVLSIACGEPLLLIGPPGTGKSKMIRAFCGLIDLIDEDDLSKRNDGYFEYLLTPFSEPGELFGFYDISKLQSAGLVRIEKGMMQTAKVIYLDEVFNGSSAILNSLLTFINERFFHDRGERKRVPMQCLFGATNSVRDSPELLAIYDRFVLRCSVRNIGERGTDLDRMADFGKLVTVGWRETYGTQDGQQKRSDLLEEMKKLRDEVKARTNAGELRPTLDAGDDFSKQLIAQIRWARQYNLSQVSNRRLIKMLNVMLMHAMYRSVRSAGTGPILSAISLGNDELKLMGRYFLDRHDEEMTNLMERQAAFVRS